MDVLCLLGKKDTSRKIDEFFVWYLCVFPIISRKEKFYWFYIFIMGLNLYWFNKFIFHPLSRILFVQNDNFKPHANPFRSQFSMIFLWYPLECKERIGKSFILCRLKKNFHMIHSLFLIFFLGIFLGIRTWLLLREFSRANIFCIVKFYIPFLSVLCWFCQQAFKSVRIFSYTFWHFTEKWVFEDSVHYFLFDCNHDWLNIYKVDLFF